MRAGQEPITPLSDLRVIEYATYVAGPSGCMTLGQLGADVIRVDDLGGAADHRRWPLSDRGGASLYWSALNKGKRSVELNLRDPEGQELFLALATTAGPGGGIVVDNAAERSWLSYHRLRERRSDVIHVRIQGHPDGRPAVDYTVNAQVGLPGMTGPRSSDRPVNHVLPAWDLLTGAYAASTLLAALRRRDRSAIGARIDIALADVALAGIGNLGWLAQADELGRDRPRDDNYVFGCYGDDFRCRDGRDVVVVGLTPRLWRALVAATGTQAVFAALEPALAIDLDRDADRYEQRETISAILRPWFAARTLVDVGRALEAHGVLWSPYGSMADIVAAFRRDGTPGVLAAVTQPGVGEIMSSRHPARFGDDYGEPSVAPTLGEHTDAVLAEILDLTATEIGRLHDRGVLARAATTYRSESMGLSR